MVDIGGSIRAARKAAGWSQEELARRAGVSYSGFTDIERGNRKDPHYSTLNKIAKALGTTPEGLIAEPVDQGKARAAASRASKVAADAKKRARQFGREVMEARYKDLISRAEAEREAGNVPRGQLYADEAARLKAECSDVKNQLANARWAALGAGTMSGSPEDQELQAEVREFEELLERLNDVVRALGGRTLSEEETEALRDQAQRSSESA